ncbi:MAG TPA: T9SS type A sorting domain-containing protein, partial [Chitinophagales bacterium]|nr:T9SS type A sorting domain-containing protein [Chitinophagales bacterium]
ICMLVLTAGGGLFAFDGPNSQPKPGRSEVKQYVKEHIMPVLISKRQELEKELTPAEKTEIASCRTSMKELRQQRRDFMKNKPEGVSMRDYMDQNRDKADAFRNQMRTIGDRLQVIAKNHSNTLDKINADLQPSITQWKQDIKRIVDQNRQGQPQNNAKEGGQFHGHGGGMPGREPFMNGLTGPHEYAMFLLLPATANDKSDLGGQDIYDGEPMLEGGPGPMPQQGNLSALKISPNPGNTQLQITGIDQLPQQNELSIFDMNGKEVLTVQNIQVSQQVDVSGLAAGQYVVRVAGAGTEVKRNIIISR